MTRMSLMNQAKEDVRRVIGEYHYHLRCLGRSMEPLSFGALKAMLRQRIIILKEVGI